MVRRYMALAFPKAQMQADTALPATPFPALRVDAQSYNFV